MLGYRENIIKTVKSGLCTSCGICAFICNKNAINVHLRDGNYIPEVNSSCVFCGKCKSICPGTNVDFNWLYENQRDLDDFIKGNNIEAYVAYAKNAGIRKNGTSGGVITQLLVSLIEENEYDFVSVLDYDFHSYKQAKLCLTNNREKILNSAKSKYLPASVSEIVEKILSEPGKKYALVGTSCQFQGIKKFLRLYNIKDDKILFLGLFCDRTLNYNLFCYYKSRYAKKGETLVGFEYRSKEYNGWPGDTKLVFPDRTLFVDKKIRTNVKDYFQLKRCIYCIDKFNQLADISFGDCYIKGYESFEGKSNIIVRSMKGYNIIKKYEQYFQMQRVSPEDVYKSQDYKKRVVNLIYATRIDCDIYPYIKNNDVNRYSYVILKARHAITLMKIKIGQSYDRHPLFGFLIVKSAIILSKVFSKILKVFGNFKSYKMGEYNG